MAEKNQIAHEMNEEGLVAILEHEISNAIAFQGEVKEQRRTAMEYYYGELFGNEIKGRSQVVSTDVADVIEWHMPYLMKVFASGDEVALFEPQDEEDVKPARDATDFVNYVFWRDNPGYEILRDMFRNALLEKTGIVKVWWDDQEEESREAYEGLDDNELQMLLDDEEVKVKAHTAAPGPEGILHDIEILRTRQTGQVRIEVVPPEEFYITNRSRSLKGMDAPFVAHRSRKTITELKWMGFDKTSDGLSIEDIGGDDEQEYDEEHVARHAIDDTYVAHAQEVIEPMMRPIWVTEAYVWVDWEGTGKAQLRKVTKAGDRILENIEVDSHPFCSITPIPIPHKFYGLSVADQTMDIQLVKSTLWRQLLDNIYTLNVGRYETLEGQVNLGDLLTPRVGGHVRVKTMGAVKRLDTPAIPPWGYQMLDYMDKVRDQRTGINEATQGMNADVLANTTVGAMQMATTAAQARVELIAREFAETGVKDIFLKIYELTVKHQRGTQNVVRLLNEDMTIDPNSDWRERTDMTVSALAWAMATGTRTCNTWPRLETAVKDLRQDPELAPMVTPKNIYNLMADGLKQHGAQKHQRLPDRPRAEGRPGPGPATATTGAGRSRAQSSRRLQMEMPRRLRWKCRSSRKSWSSRNRRCS